MDMVKSMFGTISGLFEQGYNKIEALQGEFSDVKVERGYNIYREESNSASQCIFIFSFLTFSIIFLKLVEKCI